MPKAAIREFLARNSIPTSSHLPLVHSTKSFFLENIIREGKIKKTPCDTFVGESLVYFFYGRPSYKPRHDGSIAEFWELPTLLIFEYGNIVPKRVFPFDSGAFNSYPDFIRMMDISSFDAGSDVEAAPRIVGSLFVDPSRYFRMEPRSSSGFKELHSLGPLDAELFALHKLAMHFSGKIDDRRAAIELQVDTDVELTPSKLLAVVMPEEYLEAERLVASIEEMGAEVLTYPTYPLNLDAYYALIYNVVFEFYREKGLVR